MAEPSPSPATHLRSAAALRIGDPGDKMVQLHMKVWLLWRRAISLAWSAPQGRVLEKRSRAVAACPQRSEAEQFLFETTVEATVKDTARDLAEVHNLRAKIQMLKMEGEELAKYGPAKPLDKQGIDEYSEVPVDKGPHYTMDPTGRRTGNGEHKKAPGATAAPPFGGKQHPQSLPSAARGHLIHFL